MLERELLRLTDRYTDELYRLDPAIASSVMFGVSRLVVDPERFTDDALGPMAARGADPFHTPRELATAVTKGFAARGLELAVDRPYSGALVPGPWYRRDRRVSALMIEINRRLYMNQTTGQKTAGFEETAGVLRSVLSALVTGMATA